MAKIAFIGAGSIVFAKNLLVSRHTCNVVVYLV